MTVSRGSWDEVIGRVPEGAQLDYLREILAIPSPSGEEGKLAEFVASSMRVMGVDTELQMDIERRPSVLGRLPGSGQGPSLMLLSHLDVPPMAPGWTFDPFGGIVRDGRIYGQGVRDMKAGLAAMVMAVKAIRHAGVALHGDLIFAAVPGHMEQGIGAKGVLDAGVAPECLIISEPTGLELLGAHLGWMFVEVATRGKTVGTVMAPRGVNAVEKMAKVVLDLQRMRFRAVPLSPYVRRLLPATPCYLSVATIDGGDPYNGNFVPETCKITIDVRFVPGKRPDDILHEIRSRLTALKRRDPKLRATARLKYGFAVDPVVTRPEDPVYQVTREAVRWARGRDPKAVGFLYSTDGGIFQRWAKSATVACGPGGPPFRTADEWLLIREYYQSTAAYVRAALEICGRTRNEFAEAYPPGRLSPGR